MQITLPLTVKIIYDSASSDAPYVAYTPEFDIASCGSTEDKARDNLREAVGILLEEANRKKRLAELLTELGFQKDKANWRSPRVSFEPFSMSFP